MRDPRFERLGEELREAGIAPKYVERLRDELRDHWNDLVAEAARSGQSTDEAAADARRRLGDDAAIAAEFQARPELLCWIHRSAWIQHLLRALAWAIWVCAAAGAAFARYRARLTRYGAAAASAVLATAGLLLALQAVLLAPRAFGPLVPRETPATFEVDYSPTPQPADGPAAAGGPAARETAGSEKRAALDEAGERTEPPRAVAREADVDPLWPRNGDYLPIVKTAPVYPPLAASRGLEGYVVVEFTVTRYGGVKDIVVVESSHEIFEAAAREAARKFKYRPRIVDGATVEVSGVRTKMSFELEERAALRHLWSGRA